jgi:hypothetical protein
MIEASMNFDPVFVKLKENPYSDEMYELIACVPLSVPSP